MSRKKKVLAWTLVLVLILAVCLVGWLGYKYLFYGWRPFGAVRTSETLDAAPDAAEEESAVEPVPEETEEEETSSEPDPEEIAEKAAAEDAEAEKWHQDTFESDASEEEEYDLDALLADEEIPEEIRDFVGKYPEAAEFAANYKKYAEQHISISITSEVTDGGLPMFIQWDPRWGYETYGGGFMGVRGCGPTCLAMVYSGLTGHTEWNPYRMAQWAEENGYYLQDVGTEWNMMLEGASKLGLTVTALGASTLDVENALQNGEPVICAVGPGDFTTAGHFIVLCTIDDEGNIAIHDPNSRINSSRTWTADEIVPQVKALWSYRVEGAPEEEAIAAEEPEPSEASGETENSEP